MTDLAQSSTNSNIGPGRYNPRDSGTPAPEYERIHRHYDDLYHSHCVGRGLLQFSAFQRPRRARIEPNQWHRCHHAWCVPCLWHYIQFSCVQHETGPGAYVELSESIPSSPLVPFGVSVRVPLLSLPNPRDAAVFVAGRSHCIRRCELNCVHGMGWRAEPRCVLALSCSVCGGSSSNLASDGAGPGSYDLGTSFVPKSEKSKKKDYKTAYMATPPSIPR